MWLNSYSSPHVSDTLPLSSFSGEARPLSAITPSSWPTRLATESSRPHPLPTTLPSRHSASTSASTTVTPTSLRPSRPLRMEELMPRLTLPASRARRTLLSVREIHLPQNSLTRTFLIRSPAPCRFLPDCISSAGGRVVTILPFSDETAKRRSDVRAEFTLVYTMRVTISPASTSIWSADHLIAPLAVQAWLRRPFPLPVCIHYSASSDRCHSFFSAHFCERLRLPEDV